MKFFTLISLTATSLMFCANAMSASLQINVFAVPSQSIETTMAQASEKLQEEGITSFYQQGFPAHVTLYLADYPEEKLPSLLNHIKQEANHQSPIPLTAKGFTVSAGNWAFVDIVSTRELQRLADRITLIAEPLRDVSAALPDWVNAYPNKKAAFERYGSPNVFQNFEPHLTLLAAESSPALINAKNYFEDNPPFAEGKLKAIGVGIADNNGQVSKVLAVYPVK